MYGKADYFYDLGFISDIGFSISDLLFSQLFFAKRPICSVPAALYKSSTIFPGLKSGATISAEPLALLWDS